MKTKRKVKSKKVSKNFSGETTLKQLPENTYFKTVAFQRIKSLLDHISYHRNIL